MILAIVFQVLACFIGLYLQLMVVTSLVINYNTPQHLLRTEGDIAFAIDQNQSKILNWFLLLIILEAIIATFIFS